MKILLINANTDTLYTEAERFRLFEDWDNAMSAAKKVGWGKLGYGMGLDKRVGMANTQQGGDIKLTLIAVKEE